MQALSQSSFLQALGYAIANSFWQIALLWLIAVCINACFKLSSHNRYRVAITAQLGGFAWFIVTLQFYYQQCIKANANAQLLLENNTVIYQPELVNDKYNILAYIAKAELLLPYLSVAYLCLLGVLAVRWFKSYRYTSLLKHEGLQKADMELRLFVQNMAAQLGIKHKVKIYLSSLVTCPLTIGFLKPIILVPLATINHLTTQQLEAVLLHELAHIRRADYLINLLLNVIETILFFNPFTKLIAQSINKEREHCCDDWVLQFEYNAAMYAEALLRIACLQASPAIAMKAEGKNEGELLWRVKRLLNHKQKRFNYSQQMIALVVTTCMLVSIAWLQPNKTIKHSQQVAATKPMKAVVIAPMAARVNNPMFNPFAVLQKQWEEDVQKATQEIARTEVKKAINTGIEEATEALTTVTPNVLHEIEKINIDSNINQAAVAAKKELKKVKWAEIQKLSPFIDSTYLTNVVSMALDKDKLRFVLENTKQSIVPPKLQVEQLRQGRIDLLMDQHYINAAIGNVANLINGNDFRKLILENKRNEATVLKQRSKQKRDNQRQEGMVWRKFVIPRNATRAESFNFSFRAPEENGCNKRADHYRRDEDTDNTQDHADELASWTYTNPVYVEKTKDDADDNEEEDSIYNYVAAPETPAAPTAPPCVKTLVQVVEVKNDNEHVNIIITIRQ